MASKPGWCELMGVGSAGKQLSRHRLLVTPYSFSQVETCFT